jgi:hypothetical protein
MEQKSRKMGTKNKLFLAALVLSMVMVLQSCEVVGGIFKTGMATGVILVALVIGLIIFLISRAGKK